MVLLTLTAYNSTTRPKVKL